MEAPTIEPSDNGVRIRIRVQPRASRDAVVGIHGGALKIALTAPPVEGAANAALIKLLAKQLGVPKRAVRIAAGDRARDKVVEVEGTTAEQVRSALR